jgi:hypothetical protein
MSRPMEDHESPWSCLRCRAGASKRVRESGHRASSGRKASVDLEGIGPLVVGDPAPGERVCPGDRRQVETSP